MGFAHYAVERAAQCAGHDDPQIENSKPPILAMFCPVLPGVTLTGARCSCLPLLVMEKAQ
jgi:hypothetical protein